MIINENINTEPIDLHKFPKKSVKWGKIINIILFAILFLVISTIFILSYLSPKITITKLNQQFCDSTCRSNDYGILLNDTLFGLKKEESYLKAQLNVSKSDSISLQVNLADSTLTLDIKGVSIYKAPITEYSISKIFEKIDRSAVVNMLSQPSSIINEYANVPKEPIIEKIAPKDTAEANKNIQIPDTVIIGNFSAYLYLDNGICLKILHPTYYSGIKKIENKFEELLIEHKSKLDSLFCLAIPPYIPTIEIILDKKDALAIYRALTTHALVTLHL